MLFIYGTVYNSRNRILQSLDSVMKINIEKRIFIIDNYSTDGTYEILRDNGDKYNLVVKQEKCTKGEGIWPLIWLNSTPGKMICSSL